MTQYEAVHARQVSRERELRVFRALFWVSIIAPVICGVAFTIRAVTVKRPRTR